MSPHTGGPYSPLLNDIWVTVIYCVQELSPGSSAWPQCAPPFVPMTSLHITFACKMITISPTCSGISWLCACVSVLLQSVILFIRISHMLPVLQGLKNHLLQEDSLIPPTGRTPTAIYPFCPHSTPHVLGLWLHSQAPHNTSVKDSQAWWHAQ